MRNSRFDLAGIAAPHAVWMSREHSRLDARLASAFLQTVWGSGPEARREFAAYRNEMSAHLKEGERRFFSALGPLDERTRTIERFEWKAHTRDIQEALAAVQRELRGPSAHRYEAFAALRRAMRRHRRHEQHLLQLACVVEVQTPRRAEAFL